MNNWYFAPGFMSCSASVQPGITRLTGKVAGLPRLLAAVELRAVEQRAADHSPEDIDALISAIASAS
jgi:hypothetical protein